MIGKEIEIKHFPRNLAIPAQVLECNGWNHLTMSTPPTLLAPIKDADHREVRGVQLDIVRAGCARVKRVIYPAGFRWSTHMKGVAGTELCMHAHAGFLASGHIGIEYADGCKLEFAAPQVIVIEPGHDGWVIGDEQAVVIEFDFECDTADRLGMPAAHTHNAHEAT